MEANEVFGSFLNPSRMEILRQTANLIDQDEDARYSKLERPIGSSGRREIFEFFLGSDNQVTSMRYRRWTGLGQAEGMALLTFSKDLVIDVLVDRGFSGNHPNISFTFAELSAENSGNRDLSNVEQLAGVNFTTSGKLNKVGIFPCFTPETDNPKQKKQFRHILFARNNWDWQYQFGKYPGNVLLNSPRVDTGKTIIGSKKDFSYQVDEVPEVGYFRFIATDLSRGKSTMLTVPERIGVNYWMRLIGQEDRVWADFVRNLPITMSTERTS